MIDQGSNPCSQGACRQVTPYVDLIWPMEGALEIILSIWVTPETQLPLGRRQLPASPGERPTPPSHVQAEVHWVLTPKIPP